MLNRAVQRAIREHEASTNEKDPESSRPARVSLLLENRCPHHAYRDELRDMLVGRDHAVWKVSLLPHSLPPLLLSSSPPLILNLPFLLLAPFLPCARCFPRHGRAPSGWSPRQTPRPNLSARYIGTQSALRPPHVPSRRPTWLSSVLASCVVRRRAVARPIDAQVERESWRGNVTPAAWVPRPGTSCRPVCGMTTTTAAAASGGTSVDGIAVTRDFPAASIPAASLLATACSTC